MCRHAKIIKMPQVFLRFLYKESIINNTEIANNLLRFFIVQLDYAWKIMKTIDQSIKHGSIIDRTNAISHLIVISFT